jgi:hypothetical protein
LSGSTTKYIDSFSAGTDCGTSFICMYFTPFCLAHGLAPTARRVYRCTFVQTESFLEGIRWVPVFTSCCGART